MKQLIPMDSFGIFCDGDDTARANSLLVSQMFEKRHDDVLKSIRNLDCSAAFRLRNYAESSYPNEPGKKQPCYDMTRDGFTFLIMGYRGKKAAQFKEAYIKRFNQMEKFIRTLVETRTQFPLFTEQIKLLHDEPRPYHFSNECDMLNRLVLGKTPTPSRVPNAQENRLIFLFGLVKGFFAPRIPVNRIVCVQQQIRTCLRH